jgi:hypothetical protein
VRELGFEDPLELGGWIKSPEVVKAALPLPRAKGEAGAYKFDVKKLESNLFKQKVKEKNRKYSSSYRERSSGARLAKMRALRLAEEGEEGDGRGQAQLLYESDRFAKDL